MTLQGVDRLGQQTWKVLVTGANGDPPSDTATKPEFRGRIPRLSNLQGKIESQAAQCLPQVFRLTPPFRRRSLDAGGPVFQHDRRFDFVTVLAARTGTALKTNVAFGLQFIVLNRRGMNCHAYTSYSNYPSYIGGVMDLYLVSAKYRSL